MIQRIQTVFLLAALILIGCLFFIPFADLTATGVYNFSLKGIASTSPGEVFQQPYWLTVMGLVNTVLVFVVIFLYKNRKLQMNLTIVSLLLAVALNGAMYFLAGKYQDILKAEVKYNVVFVFPVIAAILLIMAYRYIRKDELLIKSLDRLR